MEILKYICVVCDWIENLELGGLGYLIHCGVAKEIIIIIVIAIETDFLPPYNWTVIINE